MFDVDAFLKSRPDVVASACYYDHKWHCSLRHIYNDVSVVQCCSAKSLLAAMQGACEAWDRYERTGLCQSVEA